MNDNKTQMKLYGLLAVLFGVEYAIYELLDGPVGIVTASVVGIVGVALLCKWEAKQHEKKQ